MDFQYFNPTYTQDGFHPDQGVQYIFTNQTGGTYFHGAAPTTGYGVINQPVIWPDHGYQLQQHHGLFDNSTALPEFLPVTEIPTFRPVPPQGNRGMILQDGAVYFDPWLQGPEMHVDAMGQQHGTSVVLHPELQAPLVGMGGAGPQYGVPVPGPYAPHLQSPIIYVDAIGQQHGTAVPFEPQLQAPFVWVDGEGLPHGASVPFDPYIQAPLVEMDGTALQPLTTVAFSPVPAPSYEPLEFIGNTQLPWTGLQAAGLSSTGFMKPAPVVELQPQVHQKTKAPTDVVSYIPHTVPTSEPLKPKVITSTVVTEVKIEPQVTDTSGSRDSLVVQARNKNEQGTMENAEAKPRDNSISTLVESKTTPVKADANMPENKCPEKATKRKGRKRKHQQVMGEKERKEKQGKNATKSSHRENKGPDSNSMAAGDKKTRSKRAKKSPICLQPRSKLGEHMMHAVQVFHQLGGKVDTVRPPNPTHEEAAQKSLSQPKIVYSIQPYRNPKVLDIPSQNTAPNHALVCSHTQQPFYPAPKQSRPSAPVPQRQVQRPPAPAHPKPQHVVPHFYKNHAKGSVANYGDGEVVVYLKPEYPGMFPLPLVNPKPLPPGAPRRFHCCEYSNTITAERRAEREAMKRKAKLKRDEEAKVTRSGMDCSVLTDRKHLPHEPWPREDNWWETGLDDVWKFDECLEHIREDVI